MSNAECQFLRNAIGMVMTLLFTALSVDKAYSDTVGTLVRVQEMVIEDPELESSSADTLRDNSPSSVLLAGTKHRPLTGDTLIVDSDPPIQEPLICDFPTSTSDSIPCVGCSCRMGCTSCQGNLPAGACIECPRVSTLSPYFNINVFGALKLDMLFNNPRPFAAGTPFFLTPDSIAGLDQNTVDIHARQTTFGAAFTGPKFGNFQSGGLLLALLYNDSIIQDQYGFLPLQGYGELKNDDWRFSAGLQFDVFAPGIPTVLPFSALAATGNAGNSFRGQLRLERFLYPSSNSQVTMQMALSEPITTTIDGAFGLLEDNGWPNVEGRIAFGLGPAQAVGLTNLRPIEWGLSAVIGQIRSTSFNANSVLIARDVADVWGVGCDLRFQLSESVGILGEVHTGEGLGNYNGAILQAVNPITFEGVRSTGGFMELFTYWTPRVHTHAGYGVDDVADNDIPDNPLLLGRVRNEVYYANLLWDVNPTFRIGSEFTYRLTDYKAAALPDNEGPGFHTQFQWSF